MVTRSLHDAMQDCCADRGLTWTGCGLLHSSQVTVAGGCLSRWWRPSSQRRSWTRGDEMGTVWPLGISPYEVRICRYNVYICIYSGTNTEPIFVISSDVTCYQRICKSCMRTSCENCHSVADHHPLEAASRQVFITVAEEIVKLKLEDEQQR